MKTFALIWLVLLPALLWSQSIAQAEYFVDTDPGAGLGTPISVTPGASSPLNFGFDSDGWQPGLHRIFVRCYSDNGIWGAPTAVLLFVSPTPLYMGIDVTEAEYWFDNQPPTLVDLPDGNPASLSFVLPTTNLEPGLHRFYVRLHDAAERWGAPTMVLFALSPNAPVPKTVTHVEYWYDNLAPTLVDVPDGNLVDLNFLLATDTLEIGLHRLFVRTLSGDDVWGAPTAVLLAITPDLAPAPLLVTHAEYWFDEDPPTQVDMDDGNPVALDYLLPTAGLSIGLHRFSLRVRNELEEWGVPHSIFLIVSSPFGEPEARQLIAAEYFVNVDPGPGNGVPIPLPQDSVWDEAEEGTITLLAGLPSGYHRFGLRWQDDLGRWSQVIADTITVGPILTVRRVAGELVLDWVADPDAAPYHVYRGDTPTSVFTEIYSTPDFTYTDTGIIGAALKKFYYVTQTNNGISQRFRIPDRRELTPVRE